MLDRRGAVFSRLASARGLRALLACVVWIATVSAVGVAGATGAAQQSEVRSTIRKYLTARADGFVSPGTFKRSPAVVVTNETATAIASDEAQTAVARELGAKWGDYRLTTRFDAIKIHGLCADVSVAVNTDYHYASSPQIDSGIYDVRYRMRLARSNSGWRIIAIDSDSDDYRRFKAEVSSRAAGGRGVIDAANEIAVDRMRELPALKREMESSSTPAPSATARNLEPASASYTYDGSRGAAYAQRFALNRHPLGFYYADNEEDCTNFVSQCTWAAYGGYVSGNDTKSKDNIANKVRMVKNVWHAGTGGGMPNWESVSSFWAYATDSSKTRGPRATGYNNNAKYTGIAPGDVRVGNVLQFKRKSYSSYGHSTYVSIVVRGPREPASWDRIYLCYHSEETKNRMASEVIAQYGGSGADPCYMRRLSFRSATFDK